LHITKWSNGKTKRDGKLSPPQNNLKEDSEAPTKKKINNAKEPNVALENTLKKEILQVIIENFMEMLLDMVNQNVQEALKFQDTKKKEYEKTQK
jgi:hypothetical protein